MRIAAELDTRCRPAPAIEGDHRADRRPPTEYVISHNFSPLRFPSGRDGEHEHNIVSDGTARHFSLFLGISSCIPHLSLVPIRPYCELCSAVSLSCGERYEDYSWAHVLCRIFSCISRCFLSPFPSGRDYSFYRRSD